MHGTRVWGSGWKGGVRCRSPRLGGLLRDVGGAEWRGDEREQLGGAADLTQV